jgi:acetylornithine deacetylase/succinyl-diaminopimelate desuccinylase-like protein
MVVGKSAGGDGPHLLFYGHYDVQPVDPLNLWDRDPFDPRSRTRPAGKVIRGRGSADDKGQLMTFVEACRAWIAVHGSLPVPGHLLLRGRGGVRLALAGALSEGACRRVEGRLALICDTGMFDHETPGDHHHAARAAGRGTDDHRARTRTCIRACSAARR